MAKIEKAWYEELVEELRGTITEGVFTSRDVLIGCYHDVGSKLRLASKENGVGITTLVNSCAKDMGVSDRKLWDAVKFYDKFPDRALIPGGKNISWHKIKTQYLTVPKEKASCEHEFVMKCRKCGELNG